MRPGQYVLELAVDRYLYIKVMEKHLLVNVTPEAPSSLPIKKNPIPTGEVFNYIFDYTPSQSEPLLRGGK